MIISPEPTSLTDRASSVNPRVEKYRNHRSTGGIWLRLTKKLDRPVNYGRKQQVINLPSVCHEEQVAKRAQEDRDAAVSE